MRFAACSDKSVSYCTNLGLQSECCSWNLVIFTGLRDSDGLAKESEDGLPKAKQTGSSSKSGVVLIRGGLSLAGYQPRLNFLLLAPGAVMTGSCLVSKYLSSPSVLEISRPADGLACLICMAGFFRGDFQISMKIARKALFRRVSLRNILLCYSAISRSADIISIWRTGG
jgi:hypothetical protein